MQKMKAQETLTRLFEHDYCHRMNSQSRSEAHRKLYRIANFEEEKFVTTDQIKKMFGSEIK